MTILNSQFIYHRKELAEEYCRILSGRSESPRELRRLHYLREWSHDEQIKQIFP